MKPLICAIIKTLPSTNFIKLITINAENNEAEKNPANR